MQSSWTSFLTCTIMALVGILPTGGCRPEPTPVAEEETPWATSEDGVVSLRLFVEAKTIERNEPIVLIAELRNNSEQAVSVLRPFGDWYVAVSTGVDLHGPDGVLRYTGPTLEYQLDTSAFARVPAGQSIRDRLELSPSSYAGSDAPGQYRVVFTYDDTASHRNLATELKFKDFWKGQELRSHQVSIEKR